MATEEQAAGSESPSETPAGPQPISPGVRRRLQQSFEHATQNSQRGGFDYATTLFTQCVQGDPGNLVYVQSFLNNLYKKYDYNKKGSKMAGFSGMTVKGTIKKASMKKDWIGVLKSGLEMLKLNPWDTFALSAMANACEMLGHNECQLAYLKSALDANPKDPAVNKQCALALARQGQFDQAIACWHRVEQAKPTGDEEAQRAIAALSVERTIARTLSSEEASQATRANEEAEKEKRISQAASMTPEQRLKKAIQESPSEVKNYIDLAELFGKSDRHDDVEKVLSKALEMSGGDIKVREALEDAQLRRARHQLTIAEQRAAKDKTPESEKLQQKMRVEMNRAELEVFRARSDRYPANLNYKYELGVRLKRAGNFDEAIRTFQSARNDPKRKAAVLVELGECFQHIKQYQLALKNYQDALELIPEREEEHRKTALYRAGRVALHLKDLDVAEKLLNELAGLDFGYKDVRACLDKAQQLRNSG